MKAIAKGLRNGIDSILLIGIIVVNVVPFVYMFMMSFKSTINARDFDFSLDKLSFVQYQKIFAMDNFERYIFNSVFVAVAGVILTVTVCSLAGYAFAKMNFKGNDRLFLFLILTMIVPSEVIIVPLFLITKSLGWLNTFRALILPLPTAFGVFIMRQAILDVPQDLINAAKIDGCGNIRTFFKVVLPMVKSSVLALSIFTFVGAWNNFIWPLVACTKQEMKTLPLALSLMKTQFNTCLLYTSRIAAVPIAKQDLTQLIKYQAHKLEQVGVEVLLNTEVTLDMIKTDYADYEIILCGGAAPIVPGFMTEFKDYMTADDVLYGRKFPGHKIVVIGGGSVGCETADYLAPVLNDRFPKNREIILIEMAHEIMANESGPGRSLLVQRMMEKGIQIICDAKVEEVSNDTISYSKDGSTHQITDADTLVLAMGYRSNATLQEQLTETGISYSVLGDCKQLGNIKDAISQGYELARTL